nr:site-specific integrase [Cytobacillus purgationiresistens]
MDNDLVNCTSIGTPLNPSNVRRTLLRFIEKAKVPKIRFHDLRHTHATLLLSNDVHIKIISERLGHNDIKITLSTYSHLLPTMQEEAEKNWISFLDNFQCYLSLLFFNRYFFVTNKKRPSLRKWSFFIQTLMYQVFDLMTPNRMLH